jgi:CubicO group peptidase (beta-lactamase class C family)
LITTCLLSALAAGQPRAAKPAKFADISDRMKAFIASGEISGAVTLVATRGKVIYLDSTGFADLASKTPMRTDTIFWIASMTKPLTATAVLMLQDEGKLSVDDPVSKYLPEFAGLKTPSGKPADLRIRHLLTHTSGLAEATGEQLRSAKTLADLIPVYTGRPVSFEPGSRWQYCQSGINTAARVVEVASKESFPAFLRKRIFGPLGMRDTTFYLSGEQLPRLAKSYKRAGGVLQENPIAFLQGLSPTERDRYPAANGGLFSTASDYARFCRMILGGGVLGGRRLLKAESVKLMTSLQTGELKTGFTEGNGWGLGWCVVRHPQGVTGMLSAGSFGHGGAYGTQGWIDPQTGLMYILMVQRADFPNADDSEVRKAFQQAASSSTAGGATAR